MNDKPNIVFLSVFPPFKGGISRFSTFLHDSIAKHASLTTWRYKKLYPDLLYPGESQYTQEDDGENHEALLHAYQPLNWRAAANKVLEQNPDVFLFSHWHPFTVPSTMSILGRLKKHRPRILTSGIFHNVEPHEVFPMGRFLTRRLIKITDLPAVLSSQTQYECKALVPDNTPIRLFHPVYTRPLPDTPREQIRKKLGIGKDEFILLFFGLVRKYKGLDLLFRALHKISPGQSRIRIIVAGEFYIKPETVTRYIPDVWRERVTIFNRFIPDRETDELLYASDAMVLPYRSASQSGILADAVNFSLPVICTDQPGFTDVITHKKHGLVVPSGDISGLADAITAITDSSLNTEIRHQLRTLKDELSWEKFGQSYYNAICDTLKKIRMD